MGANLIDAEERIDLDRLRKRRYGTPHTLTSLFGQRLEFSLVKPPAIVFTLRTIAQSRGRPPLATVPWIDRALWDNVVGQSERMPTCGQHQRTWDCLRAFS